MCTMMPKSRDRKKPYKTGVAAAHLDTAPSSQGMFLEKPAQLMIAEPELLRRPGLIE